MAWAWTTSTTACGGAPNRDQAAEDPAYPNLGMSIAQVERLDALLMIGCNLRARSADARAPGEKGGVARARRSAFVNPARFDYQFPVATIGSLHLRCSWASSPLSLPPASQRGQAPPAHVGIPGARGPDRGAAPRRLPRSSRTASGVRCGWGALALRHAAFADLRALAAALAGITGSAFGVLAEGGNAAGAYLAGAVPHRIPGGARAPKLGSRPGRCCSRRCRPTCSSALSPGGCARSGVHAHARGRAARDRDHALRRPAAARGGACAPAHGHVRRELRDLCRFRGPLAKLQRRGGCRRRGAAGLEDVRVLGNALGLPGFEYQSAEEVRDEVRRACSESLATAYTGVLEPADRSPAPRSRRAHVLTSMRSCGAPPRCSVAAGPHGACGLRIASGSSRVLASVSTLWSALPSYAQSTAWILLITVTLILCVALLTLWERKVIGWIQLRRGPNRVRHLRSTARFGTALCRRGEAPPEGSHHPGACQQGALRAGAGACAHSGLRHLGRDTLVTRSRRRQHRCRFAVRAVAHLGGRLRHHPRRLGGQFEVRILGRHALRRADRRL